MSSFQPPPELLERIFRNLQQASDLHTLHACTLVAKQWSLIATPILWETVAKYL
ncbi:hypothetical protein K493DRAFT_319009 [Basidiobolus meristosporus CBS 931.73]|uniref:F-box domain-containing protein n=1 Tax=Basidiobolus meristosporus CBS 931.73 TaxID=1314790 RepID=A0A1Y1XUU6_9FUNG|nr:hypothetical protein K493DRAFT_319009 [Basidiobolus meristosporus CBS 931.73]|eukprot:ORX89054.1 hypothetical protein K493DRAFT_319009 [Basidiobolus meristosporus CBS 931.73]